MKPQKSLFWCLIAAFLIGCQSEIAMPEDSWGHFCVKVNGRKWEKTFKNAYQAVRASEEDFDSSACKKISLYSLLFDSQGALEEGLYLINIPLERGRHKIMPYRNYSCNDTTPVFSNLITFIDSDIFRDKYEVLDSEDNYLQIDKYQEDGNREIKGRFSVTYVLRSKRSYNSYEDTLRFTAGRFHTKILPPREQHL